MTLIMVATSALMSKWLKTSLQVNGESHHDIVIFVQCSECQSGEKFKTSAGKTARVTVTLL